MQRDLDLPWPYGSWIRFVFSGGFLYVADRLACGPSCYQTPVDMRYYYSWVAVGGFLKACFQRYGNGPVLVVLGGKLLHSTRLPNHLGDVHNCFPVPLASSTYDALVRSAGLDCWTPSYASSR
jgi:hypothetical protein